MNMFFSFVLSVKKDTERHKHIVLLHSYATAIDLMINCDAVSAIMHLALTNERYKDILKGTSLK